jgi:hypothetical protein
MYGKKDDQKPGALKRLAKAKAAKKMSSASKVGKRLDRLEMENAPRRSFLESLKPASPKKMPFDKRMGKTATKLPAAKGAAKPRLMKKGNK